MDKLLVQEDIFSEDEYFAPLPIIRKYFDVVLLSDEDIQKNRVFDIYRFRGSLTLARKKGKTYPYANALQFMPHFREYLVNPETVFVDMRHIKEVGSFPLFIRPVSGFKEFSGNVFTKESFETEYNFVTKNKNISPDLICAVCDPVEIGREWRAIFVDGEYISGSQYMNKGELEIKKEIPDEVIEFAKKIAADDYFLNIFEYVIDVAEVGGELKLVEINAFETASFYGADLDALYKAWSEV